jgi:hypothetical protein
MCDRTSLPGPPRLNGSGWDRLDQAVRAIAFDAGQVLRHACDLQATADVLSRSILHAAAAVEHAKRGGDD